ncbi:MAG: DAK2 domain-containing protein [Dehalococcoidia bacterium]|nr:DAK2 domain-containing protein [Dehalococcoidia bacterium]
MVINKQVPPGNRVTYSGFDLREMFSTAAKWLEKNASAIDALNVFPVPDGDTGTNMLMTLKSAMDAAQRINENRVSTLAQGLADGALMGARGNSGVILSQMFKGLARGFDGLSSLGPEEMSRALEEATAMAYEGFSKPVEGTMLTVIKDASKVAKRISSNNGSLVELMEAVVEEARNSVDRTPDLLPVLKEAGVVDAGGQGIYVMLSGIYYYLKGESDKILLMEPEIVSATLPPPLAVLQGKSREKQYGYCTEYVVKGMNLKADKLRKKLESKGDSLLVVGDEHILRIHIHTADPGSVLRVGIGMGSLHDLKVQNMDDQHDEFVQMRRLMVPEVDIATVAVVSGKGMEEVFRSLGITAIVPGGQTTNPSTQEILRAIEFVPSKKVIVLPNNENVIMAARQAVSVSTKSVEIIPTTSMPQGISALLAFNNDGSLGSNVSRMTEAMNSVTSIEVTKAVRSNKEGKIKIRKGQYIALVNGDLAAVGESPGEVVEESLRVSLPESAEVITLYSGAYVTPEESEDLAANLRDRYRDMVVEVINGQQPHYEYIISVE